jgi:hypothetical protein
MTEPGWVCPRCGQRRTGRFCEADGHDSAPTWVLVVTADRTYHEFVRRAGNAAAAGILFPDICPERRFRLRGEQLLIGRRSASRGIAPDVDLTGPPHDPAIGRAHAMLVARPDGSWTLVDLASANGTFLNYAPDPVRPNVPVPLDAGDRIHVGGWTTLTLQPTP